MSGRVAAVATAAVEQRSEKEKEEKERKQRMDWGLREGKSERCTLQTRGGGFHFFFA